MTTDTQSRAESAESSAARLIAYYARVMLEAQREAQPEDRAELDAILLAGSAVRVQAEFPRAGSGVLPTVSIVVVDSTGGEQAIRELRLAAPDAPAH